MEFPQLSLSYSSYSARNNPWLLITGGRAPATSWLTQLRGFDRCWAADHGIDTCQQANLVPDVLLGDGDSASPQSWDWAKTLGVSLKEYPVAKDFTDTQLALKLMIEAGAPAIIVTGAFGGRFDHAYSTMFSCASLDIPCALIDESEALIYAQPDQSITLAFATIPKAISLLPFTESCSGVTINNVRWPLTDATLTQQFPQAVSNELLTGQTDLSICVKTGKLGVYCYWEAP